MKYKIELNEQEICVLENALNAYFLETNEKLKHEQSLGDIEKKLLKQEFDLILPLLMKIEKTII